MTGMLADWALWATQDEYSGALRTSRRSAGLIIAAAMLADLIDEGAITVSPTEITVSSPAAARVVDLAGNRRPHHRPVVPAQQRPAAVTASDRLGAQVVQQIAGEPGLSPGEVLEGLAVDIRERVAQRLIAAGAAQQRHQWRWPMRREIVAIAGERDLRPASAGVGPIVKIQTWQPLTAQELLVMHLIAASSLGDVVLGHLRESTVRAALGSLDSIDARYRDLLVAAVALVRGLALTR